jgi:hypothetical protein
MVIPILFFSSIVTYAEDWKLVNQGEIPEGASPVGFIGNNLHLQYLYLCRLDQKSIGTINSTSGKCVVDGEILSSYEVLTDLFPYEWKEFHRGSSLLNSLPIDWELDGRFSYLCSAKYQGNWYPGKVYASGEACFIFGMNNYVRPPFHVFSSNRSLPGRAKKCCSGNHCRSNFGRGYSSCLACNTGTKINTVKEDCLNL